MKKGKILVQIDEDKCTNCGKCEKKCSKISHPNLCSGCGKCVKACPNNAITLVEQTNGDEVFVPIKKNAQSKVKTKGHKHAVMSLAAIVGFSMVITLMMIVKFIK